MERQPTESKTHAESLAETCFTKVVPERSARNGSKEKVRQNGFSVTEK